MFDVPATLSPSGVEKFTSCPLAFRFATIERLPEPPSLHATKGSLVHRALELAYGHPPADRTPERFRQSLALAHAEFDRSPEAEQLALTPEARA